MNTITETIQVYNQIIRLTSTGQRGDTLIKHWLDDVIDAQDLLDGEERGYFTREVLVETSPRMGTFEDGDIWTGEYYEDDPGQTLWIAVDFMGQEYETEEKPTVG